MPLLGAADPQAGQITYHYWITTAAIQLVAHGTDAVVTHSFGKKGLYPRFRPRVLRGLHGSISH